MSTAGMELVAPHTAILDTIAARISRSIFHDACFSDASIFRSIYPQQLLPTVVSYAFNLFHVFDFRAAFIADMIPYFSRFFRAVHHPLFA